MAPYVTQFRVYGRATVNPEDTRNYGLYGGRIEGFVREGFMSERSCFREKLFPGGVMAGRSFVRID